MFLQGLYIELLSWHNSHVGSPWSWVYDVGSWCGLVRSLQIALSWTIEFLIGLAAVCCLQFMWSCYFADCDLHDRVILLITIYAIMLFCWLQFMRLCYFVDCNLRDCVILAGPKFEPRAKQYDFLLVLGSISRPDCLFQASVIHGICHSSPQMVN